MTTTLPGTAPPGQAAPSPAPPAESHALPLLALVTAIAAWEHQPDATTEEAVRTALAGVLAARGATGGWVRLQVAPWPPFDRAVGRPPADGAPPSRPIDGWRPLVAREGRVTLGAAVLSGPPATWEPAHDLLQTALGLAWSRTETRLGDERLDALDAATAAISAELSLDRVLTVIVDRVRPLVVARYAALGILGEVGQIERFITSGMDEATRRGIGHPPRGHGILGLIVRENRAVRLDDLTADPRAHGFPPNHPPMRSFLGVPVSVEGRSIGNLYLTDKQGGGPFTPEDQRLVETFARHAGIAIHKARLHEELRHLAVLQERERIGQDLHDGIIQALYAVGLSLEDVADLMGEDPAEAAQRVERAIEGIHATIRDIRNFIFGLRPELLEDVDLAGGLRNLTEEFRRSTLIETELSAIDGVDLDPEDAVQLLQLAREALSNVARHAEASRVAVELRVDDGILHLVISDDGMGFEPSAARGPGHRGLSNMRARAESLGGTLTMDSRPAGGTRVVFQVPIDPSTRPEETMR